MAKTNTEKPTGKTEQKKNLVETPEIKKQDMKTPVKKEIEKKSEEKNEETKKENKTETKKSESKKTTPKIKKDYAFVNGKNVPISTKDAVAICKFIKYKTMQQAINDLENVLKFKKAVPMKGEIPHRKGKIMSGRFPKRASEHFIILLKSLQGNSVMHELENPIINEAVANIANRPFGRFGLRKKRSHVFIKVTNKKSIKKISGTKFQDSSLKQERKKEKEK